MSIWVIKKKLRELVIEIMLIVCANSSRLSNSPLHRILEECWENIEISNIKDEDRWMYDD